MFATMSLARSPAKLFLQNPIFIFVFSVFAIVGERVCYDVFGSYRSHGSFFYMDNFFSTIEQNSYFKGTIFC